MSEFTPRDWYWSVAGSATQVYSSALGDYVGIEHPNYVSWLASGNSPTRISSEVELGEVLSQYSIRPTSPSVLETYQDTQSRQITIQVVAKVLLWCVNEIRTLKGQPTVSAGQFRGFVKGLM